MQFSLLDIKLNDTQTV